MRRNAAPILSSMGLWLAIAGPAHAVELYLSTTGNNAWSGRAADPMPDGTDGPVADLRRALDVLQMLRTTGIIEPATICFRAGVYRLERAWELSEADSGTATAPVVLCPYGKETVRISGGRLLEGFAPVTDPAIRERLPAESRDFVRQADLAAQGIRGVTSLTPRGFGRGTRPAHAELYVRGEPMTLARWPNDEYARIADVPVSASKTQFFYAGDRPARWQTADEIWLHGYWTWDWAESYEQVEHIDLEQRLLTTRPPHGVYGYKQNARYYALNLLEELDQPGEWYLDHRGGRIYFWPPGTFDVGTVELSLATQAVVLRNVSHVRIERLVFEYFRSTPVVIEGGSHCRLSGCTLRNVGNNAVTIRGGSDHRVESCDLYHLGDGGISLDGGDRATLTEGRHAAVNNDIHHYGRWVATYTPAISLSGVGLHVAHNHIHHAPHMGIGLHGNEHTIEYNEIDHVCLDTADAGAFYMGRDWTQRGNKIQFNFFHHIGAYEGWHGVNSIYLDDFTSGTLVYGNVLYRAARGVLLGGGRDNRIENNIFVECEPAIMVDSRGLGWARNYFDGTYLTLFERLEAMNYRQPPYSTRYPELLALLEDQPGLAKNNTIARNICTGGSWLALHDNLTEEIVQVRNNLVGTDPHFVDAANGDFRLAEDSPAWALGFVPLPMERIGLQRDRFRTTLP